MQLSEKILILDCGSQFSQLIARRVRALGVYCEIFPHDAAAAAIKKFAPAGVILSGGPQSVFDAGAPTLNPALAELERPILGLCYGLQLLMHAGGGRVAAGQSREYGSAQVRIVDRSCPLFAGIEKTALRVWMSHGDHVAAAAAGFSAVAMSDGGAIAAVANEARRIYGLQFHPEVSHSEEGGALLENFARRICGLQAQWTMPNFIEQATAAIKNTLGDERVLLALSGGVDSAVAAALLQRAVGRQLVCVLIDNGLMRHGEADAVRELFERQFKQPLIVVDAAARFFAALAGVRDPEEKRRRIGHEFIRALEEQAAELSGGGGCAGGRGPGVQWLAQGTIYPDVVESAQTGAGKAVIKTHHNVGGLPQRLNLKLIEPLRELFKDEVRQAGCALGLSPALMRRHPFPGPGLAVRVLGEVTPQRVGTARAADKIFIDELRAAGEYDNVAQAFAVLLPLKTVGVMGDARTYDETIALRAVTTEDFMTADWAHLNPALLAKISTRLINEVSGINRVVYDISSKPPSTIEWE